MLPELPTGTVTFLFTDIEGSTRLLHELGAETYAGALAEHRRIVREAVGRHGGVEVDTQGDACFVAFPTAPGALAAAADVLAGLAVGPIRVRGGVHTGTPHLAEDGYVGVDVHRAARIAACGHGGQVLVSATTAALVGTEGLRDLGEHRLKDLSAPERLYQLGGGDFVQLKSLYQTNLPAPATPFLGREHELAEVLGRLESARLLTLTGPGGTGKTRLGLQAAAGASDRHPDGVYWVPLAPLRDPQLVLETAAHAIGATNGLAAHIADKSLLLLFDNFEHVVEAAAGLAELLGACPNLQLLVTSRELLRLPAEQAYPVPPLEPEEGTELFLARAHAVEPGFAASAAVPELCARLEQLPLALELAAARVRVLSPEQLLDRLAGRLDLLRAGRGVDARQQTLRATIEWSYDLLAEQEQWLFARLAVFSGGCTLGAAEAVCEADLDGIQSLVDKSLLRYAGERFWMLETIREFALERLEETGGTADLRSRHTAYFLEQGQLAKPELEAVSSSTWFDRLQAEHDNVRAVLGDALEHGHTDVALRLGGAIWTFWLTRGYLSEGRRWLESALSGSTGSDPHLRLDALWGAGLLAVWQGDLERGRAASDELLAVAAEIDLIRARAVGVQLAGLVAATGGDWDHAAQLYAEAAQLAGEVGDSWLVSVTVLNLGDVALQCGEYERALELFEESLAIGRERQNQDLIARAYVNLGLTTLMLGDVPRARSRLRDGLIAAREVGLVDGFILGFVGLGAAYAAEDPALAARLIGSADALCEETAANLQQFESRVRDETEAEQRTSLGEDAYAAVYAEARALALEDALALALRPD